MKKIYLLCTLICAGILSGCDSIAEDERFTVIDKVVPVRNVLIEDFTGQTCPNCPDAADVIDKLQKVYPENVIAVGIHGGPLSVSTSRGGLATPEGEEYVKEFKIQTFPSGLINRKGGVCDVPKWMKEVVEKLVEPTSVQIELSAVYNEQNREVTVKTNLLTDDDLDGKFLQVWLTESNITSFQLRLGNKMDVNYVHNHVFRAAMNGTWGEEIGQNKDFEYTYQFPAEWNVENLSVIAFIYDNTEGVLQVVDKHILNK